MHNQNIAGVDLDKLQAIADRVDQRGLFNASCDIREWIEATRTTLARRAEPSVAASIPDTANAVATLKSYWTGGWWTGVTNEDRRLIDQAFAALASPAVSQKDGAAVETHLVVGTTVSEHSVAVGVHLKRADQTIVVYARNHALNGDSVGFEILPADLFASPAATTASASTEQQDADYFERWERENFPSPPRTPAPSREAASVLSQDRFESWYRGRYNASLADFRKHHDGEYVYHSMGAVWEGWQAALAQQTASHAANAGEGTERDAIRFRWLNEDHADAETREKARELAGRLGTSSYFSITRDIDLAIASSAAQEAK